MKKFMEFRNNFGIKLVVFLITLLAFWFTSCDPNGEIPGIDLYTVTIEATEHGTVTTNLPKANDGSTKATDGLEVTITATPDDNYELDEIIVKDANGNELTVTNNKFKMPKANVTISVTFKQKANSGDEPGTGDDPNGEDPAQEITKYTVTFDSDGGSTVAAQSVEKDKTAAAPAAPTKEGYIFAGWFNGETAYDFATVITADITLKAKWTVKPANSFVVTFITGCDTQITPKAVEDGKKLTAPTETLAKTGYKFEGWTKDGAAFSFDTAITADITLTAIWTPVSYTITYNGITGATNPNTAATYTIESDDIILADATKDGFIFDGWFDTETAGNKVTKIAKGSTGNKVLYGRWSEVPANSFIVTFVTGCDTTIAQTTVKDGEKLTAPKEKLSKAGYEFAGWTKDGADFSFDTAIKANITLTAKWTPVSYTITYNGVENATNPNKATTYTIESDDITLADATKDGFIFDGWFDAETAGNKVTKIEKGSTGNKVLYARWTEIKDDSATAEITVTIAENATITVTKAATADAITLTASDGFTGYTWLIDGAAPASTAVSADGKTLTLQAADLKANAVYQISLSATKDKVLYGAQISVKK